MNPHVRRLVEWMVCLCMQLMEVSPFQKLHGIFTPIILSEYFLLTALHGEVAKLEVVGVGRELHRTGEQKGQPGQIDRWMNG